MGKKKNRRSRTLDFTGMDVRDMMDALEHAHRAGQTKIRHINISDLREGSLPEKFYGVLSALNWTRSLAVIGLEGAQGDQILRAVSKWPRLRNLWLTSVKGITQGGLQRLADTLTQLTVSPTETVEFSRFTILQALTIYGEGELELSRVTGESILRVHELNLNDCVVTSSFLRALGRSHRLNKLEIGSRNFAKCSDWFQLVGEIVNLESLTIEDLPEVVTEKELEALAGIRNLHLVQVQAEQTIPHLAKLKGLRSLCISSGRSATETIGWKWPVYWLRSQLPDCDIRLHWNS